MLNGQCSGICGGASFRDECLTLAECGKMDVLKINDDDDDDQGRHLRELGGKERKKRKKRKKREKKKERKKGTMNNVKLLHIKCCFFQFFNSLVALKNRK